MLRPNEFQRAKTEFQRATNEFQRATNEFQRATNELQRAQNDFQRAKNEFQVEELDVDAPQWDGQLEMDIDMMATAAVTGAARWIHTPHDSNVKGL